MLEAPVMDNVGRRSGHRREVRRCRRDRRQGLAQTKARALHRRGTDRLTRKATDGRCRWRRLPGDAAWTGTRHHPPSVNGGRQFRAAAQAWSLPAAEVQGQTLRTGGVARAGFDYDVAKKMIDAKDPTLWTKSETSSMVGTHETDDLAQSRCGKSRRLSTLRKKGVEHNPRVPQAAPSKAEVEADRWSAASRTIWAMASLNQGAWEKKADLGKAEVAKAIAAHPILLQRPIVVAGSRAAIGRPPEAVLPLLK
jgi:arsenate reductase